MELNKRAFSMKQQFSRISTHQTQNGLKNSFVAFTCRAVNRMTQVTQSLNATENLMKLSQQCGFWHCHMRRMHRSRLTEYAPRSAVYCTVFTYANIAMFDVYTGLMGFDGEIHTIFSPLKERQTTDGALCRRAPNSTIMHNRIANAVNILNYALWCWNFALCAHCPKLPRRRYVGGECLCHWRPSKR